MKATATTLPAILFLAYAAAAAELDVRAALEPPVIGIDETAVFLIEVHGDSFSSLRFRPDFALDNLEVLGGPSRYEDLRFHDGRLSRTLRLSWPVRPLGLGKAGARSITVQINDEIVRLPSCDLTVQREPTRAPRQRPSVFFGEEDDPFQQFFGSIRNPWRREPRQPEVFLRAELQPQNPVAGQQMLYELYLYTREDISSLSPSGVPTFHGFWVQDIPIPQRLPTEMIEVNGRRYGRVPLLRKALFPLRAGRYDIEPAAVDLTVQRYDGGFFFRPPTARPEHLRLHSEGRQIEVRRLPPPPPGFRGTVGRLSLTADLQPPQVRLGEAAILTVRLTGEGNLQGLPQPGVSAPAGLTVLPPQQEGRTEISGAIVRGSRTWRYAVVPGRAGRYTLATPEVTYFDPQRQLYQVATAPDLILTALPLPAEAGKPGGGAPHGIRTAIPSAIGSVGGRWTSLLPWLFVLPWGLVLIVTLVRRRAPSGGAAGITPGAGSAALQKFEDHLRQAESEQRPRQAAARIEEAWQGLLAQRWDAAPELAPARWREPLAARGVDAESLFELDQVIADLRYLRHAPQLSTTDSLREELISRCRRLARRLP